MGVGCRCDLGQVGDNQYLVMTAERRECVADGLCRFAPDSGVDLVENQRVMSACAGRSRQDESQCQHRSGKLATRCHADQWQHRRPRICGEEELHAIPRMIVAMFTDFDSNGRIRHGQSAEPVLYRSCQLGRRCPAGTPDRFGNGALFGDDDSSEDDEFGGYEDGDVVPGSANTPEAKESN